MSGNNIDKSKLTSINVEERAKLDFNSGDTVRVWSKILEEKESTKANKKTEKTIKFRLQAFEGVVLSRKHGTEIGATFTVRRVASGVGVERIFPLFSPNVEKIEITKKARARKSKIYYVRDKAMRDVRRKLRSVVSMNEGATEEDTEETKEE